jgi:hypothetical protein
MMSVNSGGGAHFFAPWNGFFVLCVYAVVALVDRRHPPGTARRLSQVDRCLVGSRASRLSPDRKTTPTSVLEGRTDTVALIQLRRSSTVSATTRPSGSQSASKAEPTQESTQQN